MKKLLCVVCIAVMCLGLCACSGEYKEEDFADQWTCYDGTGFVLLSSGKYVYAPSLEAAADSFSLVNSGTWEMEGNYLIRYNEKEALSCTYKILDEKTLLHNGVRYTKGEPGFDKAAVNEKLKGKWKKDELAVYTFENGRFALGSEGGNYDIQKDHIVLYWDNGVVADLRYTYYDGHFQFGDLQRTY